MRKSILLEWSPVKVWTAFVTFAAVIAMILLKPVLPHGEDTTGFAPQWAPLAGAILGAIALLLAIGSQRERFMPRRLVSAASWVAILLMVWSSAGIVFDVLRIAAVAGIPGLPPVVDWTGFALRAICLTGVALLFATNMIFQRHARGACIYCGRSPDKSVAVGNRPAYAALVLAFPYPLLKIYWSLGGTLGAGHTVGHYPAYGETLMLVGSALLSLALVRHWGRIVPEWVPLLGGRKVPRGMIITAGWIAAGLTIPMGVLAIFGSIMQALGLINGPVRLDNAFLVLSVYGVWMLYGISTAAATLLYAQQTAPECRRCKHKPSQVG